MWQRLRSRPRDANSQRVGQNRVDTPTPSKDPSPSSSSSSCMHDCVEDMSSIDMEELKKQVVDKLKEGISDALKLPDSMSIINEAVNDALDAALKPIMEEVTAFNAKIDEQNRKVEDLSMKVQKQTESINKLNMDMTEKITTLNKRISELSETTTKQKIQIDNTQTGKANNIIVHGLKEESDENLTERIKDLAELINISIGSFTSKRLGKPVENKTRPVQVIFSSIWDKRKMLLGKTKLRENGVENVFFNEDLTKPQAELFFHARQARQQKFIVSTWCRNGLIYVKKTPTDEPTSLSSLESLTTMVAYQPKKK